MPSLRRVGHGDAHAPPTRAPQQKDETRDRQEEKIIGPQPTAAEAKILKLFGGPPGQTRNVNHRYQRRPPPPGPDRTSGARRAGPPAASGVTGVKAGQRHFYRHKKKADKVALSEESGVRGVKKHLPFTRRAHALL
jgi:hypothetical protein